MLEKSTVLRGAAVSLMLLAGACSSGSETEAADGPAGQEVATEADPTIAINGSATGDVADGGSTENAAAPESNAGGLSDLVRPVTPDAPVDSPVPGIEATQVAAAATAEVEDEIQTERLPADAPTALPATDEESGAGDPLPPVDFDAHGGLACSHLELALIAAESGDGANATERLDRAVADVSGSAAATVVAAVGSATPDADSLSTALDACVALGYER